LGTSNVQSVDALFRFDARAKMSFLGAVMGIGLLSVPYALSGSMIPGITAYIILWVPAFLLTDSRLRGFLRHLGLLGRFILEPVAQGFARGYKNSIAVWIVLLALWVLLVAHL
jgi:hypothetical protein